MRFFVFIGLALFLVGCGRNSTESGGVLPSSLKEVPAVRLNYRYEADVPAPDVEKAIKDERNAAVQNDFDQNRPQELLDKTLTSPDGNRVLAVYHKTSDLPSEFRLDMYAADGRLLQKITADLMAVHFPDTIRWSPDSSTVAFVAMLRGVSTEPEQAGPESVSPTGTDQAESNTANTNVIDANANTGTGEPLADANTNAAPAAPTPAAPTGILTFRTEQIYICNSEGADTKPLTQNEGLIYFYYVWSPDSSALAAMAATQREWLYLDQLAGSKGEVFVPVGRPRLIEKTGRERRLDDALTPVQPVWSPDSAKVAVAFDKQIRIYDAGVNSPTQAAVPLRNNLLLSSQAFDRDQAAKLNAANMQTGPNAQAAPIANSNQQPTTLPDESSLVSFNPIVALSWPSNELLYFQTAYIRRMRNESESAHSFPRWHRLILTPQAVRVAKLQSYEVAELRS